MTTRSALAISAQLFAGISYQQEGGASPKQNQRAPNSSFPVIPTSYLGRIRCSYRTRLIEKRKQHTSVLSAHAFFPCWGICMSDLLITVPKVMRGTKTAVEHELRAWLHVLILAHRSQWNLERSKKARQLLHAVFIPVSCLGSTRACLSES